MALFRLLMALGQIDLFVSLAYVLFLGTIGALMLIESLGAMLRSRQPASAARPAAPAFLDAWLAAQDALSRIRDSTSAS